VGADAEGAPCAEGEAAAAVPTASRASWRHSCPGTPCASATGAGVTAEGIAAAGAAGAPTTGLQSPLLPFQGLSSQSQGLQSCSHSHSHRGCRSCSHRGCRGCSQQSQGLQEPYSQSHGLHHLQSQSQGLLWLAQ